MKKEFTYSYLSDRHRLLRQLNHCVEHFIYWNNHTYQVKIKSDSRFFLCLHKHSHTPGIWYIAEIDENEFGKIVIRGRIVSAPDEEGRKPRKGLQPVWSWLFLWPIAVVQILVEPQFHIKRRKQKAAFRAELINCLDYFMLEYLGCTELD